MHVLNYYVYWSDQPNIYWLNITGEEFEAENLTIIIEWESNSDCFNFTLSLTPSPNNSSSDYSITTDNKSHIFNILYNINYTVTVIASNGNSSSNINKMFNFSKCSNNKIVWSLISLLPLVKCEPPSYQEHDIVYDSPALENTHISFSCPPGYGFFDCEHTNITSTCTNEAVWSPDLSSLQCLS